ncbi:hypothetical protein [Agrococcus jejuensis]|nr:hypothetical protein [Agrococcus jejuensis]
MRVERAARRGPPDGVPARALDGGPIVRRLDADRIVVALLAPADAAPVAITTRRHGDAVHAVFQPSIGKGPRREPVPWHYVLRLPDATPTHAPLTVRIVGLGFDPDVDVEVPPLP